jgi:NADP-dependent 3-hydroxy acid dehydrogenase YdfG
MTLENQVAIVTGASAGIGKATALALANEGAHVTLAARREAELETLAERIEATGGDAAVIPTDLRDKGQVASMVETTRDTFDGLDILVNSAGVVYREPVATVDPNKWRREIETTLLGLMTASQIAVTGMLEQGTGHIVNVSSLNARKAAPGASGYTASKFGVNGFSEALRQEVTTEGIRVTVIEPGAVATTMQPDEVHEAMQLLEPADVANAIVFAVSQPEYVSVNDIQLRPTDQEF